MILSVETHGHTVSDMTACLLHWAIIDLPWIQTCQANWPNRWSLRGVGWVALNTHTHTPSTSLCNQGGRQAGLWVTTATVMRGDSSLALEATTSSAVETAERVRQARTEARFADLGGRWREEWGRTGTKLVVRIHWVDAGAQIWCHRNTFLLIITYYLMYLYRLSAAGMSKLQHTQAQRLTCILRSGGALRPPRTALLTPPSPPRRPLHPPLEDSLTSVIFVKQVSQFHCDERMWQAGNGQDKEGTYEVLVNLNNSLNGRPQESPTGSHSGSDVFCLSAPDHDERWCQITDQIKPVQTSKRFKMLFKQHFIQQLWFI